MNYYNLGGKVSAKKQRERALETYYKNPKICKNCKKIIKIKKDQKVRDVRKRVYCSNKCRTQRWPRKIGPKEHNCAVCGGKFILKVNSCLNTYIKDCRCPRCKENKFNKWLLDLGGKTKETVFLNSKNWQSARTAIRKHAYMVYVLAGKDQSCFFCGYKKHFNVAHFKSVSSFDKKSLIKEINNLKNLFGLCPTHHWEFDNNQLDEINKEKLVKTITGEPGVLF